MKAKLPKSPSYQVGNVIEPSRFCYESDKSASVVLKEFVGMGSVITSFVLEGFDVAGHTEVWRGEKVGGEWDGAFFQGHVFFPQTHGYQEPVKT